ncbi:hypothetical protein Btru_041801 [Bulinus truncatus]|nr:hypothetical protein Btru_041801 [Bulinus truncatus]
MVHRKNKITLTISKSEFKKALNMLVLQNGAYFNMFSSEGMEILTREMARKFGVKINRDKTLAALDINAKHKAEDIQNALESVIDRFGIRKDQILGISSDNGSNMVKVVKDFGKVDEINNFLDDNHGEANNADIEANKHVSNFN